MNACYSKEPRRVSQSRRDKRTKPGVLTPIGMNACYSKEPRRVSQSRRDKRTKPGVLTPIGMNACYSKEPRRVSQSRRDKRTKPGVLTPGTAPKPIRPERAVDWAYVNPRRIAHRNA